MAGKKTPYWWSADPDENVFMEVTRRDDIGADLKAPATARGGVVTPGYALVSAVKPGDIVLHYDGKEEAIVGASLATGGPEPTAIYWVARGSYARRAGEQARWLPGIRVPLARLSPITPQLTLDRIREQQKAILRLRAEVEAKANGKPIYFPWVPYGEGPIRTFQSYLVKMPHAAIDLFPELRSAVGQLAEPDTSPPPSAPDLLSDDIAAAAGRSPHPRHGQGYLADQALRTAIEAHAMNAAVDYYSADWQVDDVHSRESFDLLCSRGEVIKHVEVKGTTTGGTEVVLTPNEVQHARSTPGVALFVLHGIRAARQANGSVEVDGGTPMILDPWSIDAGELRPVGYRYTLPEGVGR